MGQQHRTVQGPLPSWKEFPHYAMVVNAEDMNINAVNPAYKQLLGFREIINLPCARFLVARTLMN